MFGIGMTELIIILVIALLVIGPDKLPELARALGKGLAEFKKTAEDFRNTIHEDLEIEEEKGKLLKKTEQNKDSKSKKEKDLAKENHDSKLKNEVEEGPIADQAPSPKFDPKNKSDNKN
jgi:sec-independent protein translocase protein TatA